MFSLKQCARRNVRIVAVGAAASVGLVAATTQAAVLQWDPGNTPLTPSGGPGNFNNTDSSFSNGATDQAAAAGDDVTFGAAAGTGAVNVNAPTTVNSLTLNPSTGTYSFTGANLITLAGANVTVLSNAAGNNTITSAILMSATGSGTTQTVDVGAGNFTVGNLTSGNYASVIKSGNGRLTINGTFSTSNGHGLQGLDINGGTMMLSGPSNAMNGGRGISVVAGATIGGNAQTVLGDVNASLNVNGHVAPGANPDGSNFGAVGVFGVTGPYGNGGTGLAVNFNAASSLDLDLQSLASYDVFNITNGNYGATTLNIASGAVVDINGGTGTLETGTYHIITMNPNSSGQVPARNIVGTFETGDVPAGYDYQFVTLGTTNAFNGIDLIVTAATTPEPASLALLGIGAGLLFTRKRRGT